MLDMRLEAGRDEVLMAQRGRPLGCKDKTKRLSRSYCRPSPLSAPISSGGLQDIDLLTKDVLGKPTAKQLEAFKAFANHKFTCFGGSLGGGKLLDVNTPIPTPGGWTTMGELKIGDSVIDNRGLPCSVVWVSDVEEEDTYRLTFSDGSEIVAGGRHQWVTRTFAERQRMTKGTDEWRAKRRESRVSRVSGRKSEKFTRSLIERNRHKNRPPIMDIPTWGIRTTEEIRATLMCGVTVNHSVDVAGAFELPERDLPLDPYVLGAWLGDGSTASGDITGIDPQIFEEITLAGYVVSDRKNPTCHGILGLPKDLRSAGVLGFKHIPPVYLRSSKRQRLALLQGLMDTDGTADKRGQCEISLTNRKLAEGVQELILSLGIKCNFRESVAKLYGRIIGPCFKMKFLSGDPVFRLDRKLARQKRADFRGTHTRRYIVKVEPVERVPLRCIQVDSPSHCYLCGREMIPTHNSRAIRMIAPTYMIYLSNMRGIKTPCCAIFSSTYPTLAERQMRKIDVEYPSWLGRLVTRHDIHGRCFLINREFGGGVIHLRNLSDPSEYKGAEWCAAFIEEATENDYSVFNDLWPRLRWPGLESIECKMFLGCNPGGIGHHWVKSMFIEPNRGKEWAGREDWFAFVPSRVTDNPHLPKSYLDGLKSLSDPEYNSKVLGSWDDVEGMPFGYVNSLSHGIDPIPVPDNWPIVMTYDGGFGKPFSIGWWMIDNDGRKIRFDEWYGGIGVQNKGLRLTENDICLGVIEREKKWGFWGDDNRCHREIDRIAGHDCLASKPNYQGGGQGPSPVETWIKYGMYLRSGDPDRKKGFRAMTLELQCKDEFKNPVVPNMVAFRNCKNFFRLLSTLPSKEHDSDDVDTNAEDHLYDECRHIAMSRPLFPVYPEEKFTTLGARDYALVEGKIGRDVGMNYVCPAEAQETI